MITIDVDNANVTAALERLAAGITPAKMKVPLMKIGQELVESTLARFAAKTAADGTSWTENAPATQALKGRNDPLVDTGIFSRAFHFQVADDTLFVGTNYLSAEIPGIGAAVHQFGRRDGKIPARPFLGLSLADEKMIEEEVSDYLRRLIP